MSDPRREDEDEHGYVHVHEDVHGGRACGPTL